MKILILVISMVFSNYSFAISSDQIDQNKIATTIGLYPDGSYKVNGVSQENLLAHIDYNKKMRPGRILLVNGIMIHNGMMSLELVERLIKCLDLKSIKADKDTSPYQ